MNFKDLINIAKEKLSGLSQIKNPDFRLEQAEYDKKEKVWDIVISYLVENTNPGDTTISTIASAFKYRRLYKKLKIDENKEVRGLYIFDK